MPMSPRNPSSAAKACTTTAASSSSSTSSQFSNAQSNQDAPLVEFAMSAAWALYCFRNQQDGNAPALAESTSQATHREDVLDQTLDNNKEGDECVSDDSNALGVSLLDQPLKEEEYPELASTQANDVDVEADADNNKTGRTFSEANESQRQDEEEAHPDAESSNLVNFDDMDAGNVEDKTGYVFNKSNESHPLLPDQSDKTFSDSNESHPLLVDQSPNEVESLADEQRSIAHSLDDSQDSFWRQREQLFNLDDDDDDDYRQIEENLKANAEKEQEHTNQGRVNQELSSDIQGNRYTVSTALGSDTGGIQTEHEPSPKKKSRVSFQEGDQESSFANVQPAGGELDGQDPKSKKRKTKDKKRKDKKKKRPKKDKKKSDSQTLEERPPEKASSESSNTQLWRARDVDLQKVRENLAQARPKILQTTKKPMRVQPSGVISSSRQGQKRLSSRVSSIPTISRTGSTQIHTKPSASSDGLGSDRQNLNPTRASLLPHGVTEQAPNRTAQAPLMPRQALREAWNNECMASAHPDRRGLNGQRPTTSFGPTTNEQMPVQQSLGRQNLSFDDPCSQGILAFHGMQSLRPTHPVKKENTVGAFSGAPRFQQTLPQTSGVYQGIQRGDILRSYSNDQTQFTEETPEGSVSHQARAAQVFRGLSGAQADGHPHEIAQLSRSYSHPKDSWPNVPHGKSNINQNDSMYGRLHRPQEVADSLKVYCSERFVETWPVVVAELTNGDWQREDGKRTEASHPIELVECPIVDQSSVDIELGSQSAIVLCPLSSLSHETTRKATLLPIVSLCALGRYRDLFVILVLDKSPPAAHVTSAELQLHSATIRQIANLPTATHVKTAKEAILSESIAEIILASSGAAPSTEKYLRHELRNDFVSQRAQFLLELVPTMTSRGAIQSLNMADELGGFADLFTSERIRQQVSLRATSNPSQAPDIPPKSMVQLSQGSRAHMGRPANSQA